MFSFWAPFLGGIILMAFILPVLTIPSSVFLSRLFSLQSSSRSSLHKDRLVLTDTSRTPVHQYYILSLCFIAYKDVNVQLKSQSSNMSYLLQISSLVITKICSNFQASPTFPFLLSHLMQYFLNRSPVQNLIAVFYIQWLE